MTSKLLFSVLGPVLLVVLALLTLVWLFQRKLIYLPLGDHVPAADDVLPGAEDVAFTTDDGLTLAGWFLPRASERGAATALVFNGNAGNRSLRAPLARALSVAGISVMLFDYRGYGGNPGRPTEAGLLRDARAARAYLESRDDVDPARIVYFGESLGAAVALAGAVERPPAALVLRSPFTSMVDIGALHYPFLPVRTLLTDRYPSLERVRDLHCPLLVLAGGADDIVPPGQSRALFESAPLAEKRFVLIYGAGHNDWELLAGERMIGEIVDFVAQHVEISSGARPPAAGG